MEIFPGKNKFTLTLKNVLKSFRKLSQSPIENISLLNNILIYYNIYSKSTIETLENGWKICIYSQLWTYFTHFSSVSFVDFEQVNVSEVRSQTMLFMMWVQNLN